MFILMFLVYYMYLFMPKYKKESIHLKQILGKLLVL